MKLLSIEKVKDKIDIKEEQQKVRIENMRKEEKDVSKRLNDILLKEQSEKLRIRENTIKNESSLKVKKSILEKEVELLEDRKKIALIPINALKSEVEESLKEAKSQLDTLISRHHKLDEKESIAIERIDKILDRESELLEKERFLSLRESGIKAAEQEIQRSTDHLANQWIEFHKSIHNKNTEFEIRENNIIQGEKLNESNKKSNSDLLIEINAERKRVQEEDRAVQDKYAALAQAKKHLGINI